MEENGLPISKLTGFSPDCALVMIGEKSGVAAQLRQKNQCIINIHCFCHKLALSYIDTNENITYIIDVEANSDKFDTFWKTRLKEEWHTI